MLSGLNLYSYIDDIESLYITYMLNVQSPCRLWEDVVAVPIRLLDRVNHMLQQNVLINDGVDVFAGANDNNNDRTFLAVTAYHSQDHLLQWSLRFGRDADVGSTLATGRPVKYWLLRH
jgi:hypothetical protein